MIVVDVNILAYYFIDGEQTKDAKMLWHMESEWIAPTFWRVEFQSILSKYVRLGYLPTENALALLDQAIVLLSEREKSPPADKVLRDALSWGITVYDAQYVSLANHLGVPCLTEDRAVLKACPDIAVSMQDYIARHGGTKKLRETKAAYRVKTKK